MAETTTIARDTAVSGRIEGDDDLTVEGRVDGAIELSETLTIGPAGRIDGEVSARQVIIEGSFEGDIVAGERVVLAASARAVATIEAPLVEMADGARLRGELKVGVDGATATGPSAERSRPAKASATAGRSRATQTTQRSTAPAASSAARGATTTATAPTATTTTTVVEETTEAADEDDEPEGLAEATEETVSEETLRQYREDFTVKELREKLRDRDLQVSGTKDELIERLITGSD